MRSSSRLDRRAAWWRSYFDADFLQIYAALLEPQEAAAEVDALVEVLSLRPGARVLDLACGWGRHSVELAALGLQVTGVDLSAVLLREAARRAHDRGSAVHWVCADMHELPLTGPFDVVLSLFSSLGYQLSDEADLLALREARRVLRPGGVLLLETMHRDLVAREYVERDWWEGPDGAPVWVEREFDAVRGVSREWLRWSESEKYHEIRVRSATEWEAMLAAAGFETTAWYGGWDLLPFEHTAERLIVCARTRR